MNLKQFMEQKADEEFSSVLSESEKEYCRQLEAEYPVHIIADKRRLWVFFSCAFAIFIAAVITICVIFRPSNSSPLKYQGEKESVTSNITDLNSDTKYFEISLVADAECKIALNYDVESGDKLYYEMDASGFLENSRFVFVINPDYNYDIEKTDKQENKEPLNGYEINYYSSASLDSAQYTAWIQLNTETVYITYTQVMPLGDKAFFDYVQSVIKLK
ncbi:MAG: hypothetical protein K2N14_02550 [Clostridia bacterium]|nr:hypothetical protein [Clostridia bacterium]